MNPENTPLFPDSRSGQRVFSGASRQKQIHSSPAFVQSRLSAVLIVVDSF